MRRLSLIVAGASLIVFIVMATVAVFESAAPSLAL